jgi:hypothetical protein
MQSKAWHLGVGAADPPKQLSGASLQKARWILSQGRQLAEGAGNKKVGSFVVESYVNFLWQTYDGPSSRWHLEFRHRAMLNLAHITRSTATAL